MNLVENLSQILYEKTKERPLILHMDAIGLFRFGVNQGRNIEEIINNKLSLFCEVLLRSEEKGANILIPTFSYTITKGEVFDVLHTPSEVGAGTEHIRKQFPHKRTFDPIFSYLVFSKNERLHQDFKIKDFDTFGKNSLLGTVFDMNGWIGSIGDVLWRTTEAHFIEQNLNVAYRFNKLFTGKIRDRDGYENSVESIFFCRDLSIERQANFKPIVKEMQKNNFVKNWCLDDFCIEVIAMQELDKMMRLKYKEDQSFFTKKIDEN